MIVSIVERELGTSPDVVERVDEGLLHETYELSCDGEEYILQFSSEIDGDRVDSLRRGLNCYVMLRGSEIPVPTTVTEEIREFDDRWYTLVKKLPGKTGKLDISPEKVRNAGRYLAEIHNVRSFETPGWIRFENREPTIHAFQEGTLKQRILKTIEEVSDTLRENEMETAGEGVESVFQRRGAALPDDFGPVFCHDDFSPDNIMFQNGEVVGILDFDRAHASHAQRDLVKAANGFWMHDPGGDWDIRTDFYKGYREVNELNNSFEENEPLYRVETLASTVSGLLELGELSEYEKKFYAEKILKAIERIENIYN
jgi:Ser/Thr protein kinase RdoA (MazF antagonist)